ncbi:hypothetical protein [Nocardia sp. XZ_19_385]|uniref:hypothetical protein n=1 Tax=Nocardia sp. XZ_19_385 TaxID=2769488 RepID=UPI00188FE4F5|nr:hypothetical protein [Nocardia sp. XZ_19_385]
MNGRTIARATAAVTSLGIGAVLTMAGPASAEPNSPDIQGALAQLTEKAGADVSGQAGVAALSQYTQLVDVSQLRGITPGWTPFAYAAPTFGCGSNGPITTIIAAANSLGPQLAETPNPSPGSLRFSASPAHTGIPLNSGLVVAWVNVNNGASGIDILDDRTEAGLPSLTKTVNSGPGTVIASMWGVINYPFANCVMTPTVGLFSVPDLPPPPAPDAPAEPGPNTGSGDAIPAPQAPASINEDLRKPTS